VTLGVQAASLGAVDVLPECNLASRRRNGNDAEVVARTIADDDTQW
jgi:hypothetical protein